MLGEKCRYRVIPVQHKLFLPDHESFHPLLVFQHCSPDILQDMWRPGKYATIEPVSKVLVEASIWNLPYTGHCPHDTFVLCANKSNSQSISAEVFACTIEHMLAGGINDGVQC